jgi:hypothetical protein
MSAMADKEPGVDMMEDLLIGPYSLAVD